jgi:nucleoside-triphosphatase THEP1
MALDPVKGGHIFISGKKGQGKSVLARRLFDSYPYDRLVLDVTGDLTDDFRRDGVKFVTLQGDALPITFPRGDEGEPVTAVLAPDMGDEGAAMDQMDRALGLAMDHRRTLVWCDEVGSLSKVGKTPPNLRRALHHGRHRQLFLLLCGPRPKDIDPLCISQADVVATFRTPNPADRKRIAENIGWPPHAFDAAVHALGPHEYLWYDATAPVEELLHMPPLPRREVDMMETAND